MTPCTIGGCTAPQQAIGLCNAHYQRRRRYGSPTGKPQPRESIHVEDIEFMADTGETFEGAAARLGMKPNSLVKHLARKGRQDLIRRFDHPYAA